MNSEPMSRAVEEKPAALGDWAELEPVALPPFEIEARKAIAREEEFVNHFIQSNVVPAAQARCLCMYSDIIQRRDPYCYHLE